MNNNDIKKCPYCGEEILAVAKKCKHCGEWLPVESSTPKIQCPICGELVDEGTTQCPHCNENISSASMGKCNEKSNGGYTATANIQNNEVAESSSNNKIIMGIVGCIIVFAIIWSISKKSDSSSETVVSPVDSTAFVGGYIGDETTSGTNANTWKKGFYKTTWGEDNESDPYIECPTSFNGRLRAGSDDVEGYDASLKIKIDKQKGLQFTVYSDYCNFTMLSERISSANATLRINGEYKRLSDFILHGNTFIFTGDESSMEILTALALDSFDILFEGYQERREDDGYDNIFSVNFHVADQSAVFKDAIDFIHAHIN